MDFTEDPDHRLIRAAIREICTRFPDEYWAELDQGHTFPWEFYDAMAKGGWIGIAIPAEYGGGGCGIPAAQAEGVEELIAELLRRVPQRLRRPSGSLLFAIDHCFPIRGQGTVLTGTVLRVQLWSTAVN